jgi:thiol-disulfide isomerase/thioredoxin
MGLGLRRAVCLWTWNAFVIAGLLLLACGRYPLGNPAPLQGGIPPSGKKLTLALFGAPWSADAQSLLPAVQAELNKLPEADRVALDVVLYVTSAANPALPATQALADQYLAAVGVQGRAVPDEWKHGNFKKWVGGSVNLPAAAVVDLEGNVVRSFLAGATTFIPGEIAAAAQSALPRLKTVTLALFGAPWCSECKTDLPAIQARLDALTNTQRAFIDVVLYVTTAANPSAPPTQEGAEQYLSAVHLKGRAFADEWRWKTFKKLVGGGFVLPGAAVLDSEGNVLRAYRAGPTTFVPGEIVDFALKSTQ